MYLVADLLMQAELSHQTVGKHACWDWNCLLSTSKRCLSLLLFKNPYMMWAVSIGLHSNYPAVITPHYGSITTCWGGIYIQRPQKLWFCCLHLGIECIGYHQPQILHLLLANPSTCCRRDMCFAPVSRVGGQGSKMGCRLSLYPLLRVNLVRVFIPFPWEMVQWPSDNLCS